MHNPGSGKSIFKENNELYKKIESHVSDLFKQAGKDAVLVHSRRTVFWLLKLKPAADEGLKIAALAHDIERTSPPPPLEHMIAGSSKGWMDPVFLRRHSETGAEIIAKLMGRLGADPKIIERVKFLVAGHEFSGTNDQNLIKDADSVSFFENNVEEFLRLKVKKFGKEKVRAKFEWMFERISSSHARQIAEPMYKRAIAGLSD
jgi:hypothetical protein